MTTRRAAVVLWGPLMLLGCAGAYEGQFMANLRRQASFDLNCAEPNLQVVSLNKVQGLTRAAGVMGCDQRASYTLNDAGGWVRNADGSQ